MRVGVVGAGQLGRMIALAGYPLGIAFRLLDPAPNSPGGQVAEQIVAAFEDREALARLAEGCDVVTYEFENVPVDAAAFLQSQAPLYPPLEALREAQDRLLEKRLFQKAGAPVPSFAAVSDRAEFDQALQEIGYPCVLKTRRLGYDGKGQATIRTPDEANDAWGKLQGAPLILEAFVRFDREVSLVAARSVNGEIAFYPLVQNWHRDGILRQTVAPAPNLSPALQSLAEGHMRRIMETLCYAGVLAIEFFQVGDTLLINEMAPRVHNSGHWTIEGAETSQFENHLRAILGLPLGGTAVRGFAAMRNIIGEPPSMAEVLRLPETHLHLYGKSSRPGRKIGHINLRANTESELQDRLAALAPLLEAI